MGPTNNLCVCHIDVDQTAFISQPLLSKNRGLAIKFLKVWGHFTLKEKTRGVDLYYYQNMRCQIEPFPIL